uniref:Amine oxidase n=1 Tax=Fagus sylvatica TaxID=28930 RepID=A0A2N9EH24_FAGSY
MFVPYMDPTEEWYYKNFFDSGEFGFGQCVWSLKPLADCPANAVFLDSYYAANDGTLVKISNTFCIFENHVGSIIWRHTEFSIPGEVIREVRPEVSLVVRMVATVGNYDYILDWEFKSSDSIKFGVGLTGVLEVKGVTYTHIDQIKEDVYGTLLADNTIGVYHDHFLTYYLDLDVDGEANSFVKNNLETIRLGLEQVELVVLNPNKKTKVGNNVGYRLIPGSVAHPLLSNDDYPQIRGAFTKNNVAIYEPWLKQEVELKLGFSRRICKGSSNKWMNHTGSIERLHLKVDGLEAGVAEIRAMMQEQIPIAPREAHGVPLGAKVRNAMPMKPLNQDFRGQANQPRVGMQTGEFFENGQNGPILGEFGDPIEERRNVRNNARFMPPFQGHFDAPYEEPWLGRRQGRQQGSKHRGGRQARGRPRQYQGAHHRDPYWQEQDGPPWNQGRARDPRPMKLDFPRFKGGDPTAWVYRALQYFHYYQVPKPLTREELYKLGLRPASYDDPMELLTKLKQTHTIVAYKSQFESTSNRVRDLSDMHKLSCFMSGMKDEIRLAVKMQGPRNLGEAYALAKIQEEYLTTVKRSTRPTFEPSRGLWVQSQAQQGVARVENKSGDSKQFSARPSMPVQRLTPMQMLERRKKGLCYNCDERWSSDHRCKNRKLYLMEEVEDEEAELIEIEEEEVEAELEDEKAEITLCAFTHNFMDETLAKTLKLPIDVESNFGVRVANGQESGMKIKVLALIHDSPLGGHSGYLKSLHRVKKDWFWHGMKKDIKAYIRGCDTCQRLKHETSKPAGLLQPLAIPSKPWHSIMNKSLEHYLRAFAADKPSLWVEWLPLAEYWFNTNYHTSTKLSPFEALYGYLPPRLIEFVPRLTRVAAVEDLRLVLIRAEEMIP